MTRPSKPTNGAAERLPEPALLDARGVAALLAVSERTVWGLHSSGRLGPTPVSLGRARRWSRAELLAWIEAGCPERGRWQVKREAQRSAG
jgi:predicted DNA-binding transcriptional regulator AlpA